MIEIMNDPLQIMILQGKKIFITGGSKGIGASCVRICSDLGADVGFTYLTGGKQAEQLKDHSRVQGKHLSSYRVDVRDYSGLRSAIESFSSSGSRKGVDGIVVNAGIYRQQSAAFHDRWLAAIIRWEELAAPLKARRIIAHHKSWVYLEDWLELEELATLEPVAGIPPTPSHLAGLLSQFGNDGQGADLIIRAPYQSEKASQWLSDRTSIPAVMLPMTVGGSERSDSLFTMFDDIVNRLLESTE